MTLEYSSFSIRTRITWDIGPGLEVDEEELEEEEAELEVELAVVLDDDCSEDVEDVCGVEEDLEVEGLEFWVVELVEAVEVPDPLGDARTYAALSRSRATTKAIAATCALLAPDLFKKAPP